MTLFIIIEIFDFPPEKCQGVIFNQEKRFHFIQKLVLYSSFGRQQHPSKIEEGKKMAEKFLFLFSLDCFQVAAAASHQKQDGQQNHFRKIANVVTVLSLNVMNSPTRHQNKYLSTETGKSGFRKIVFQRLFFNGLNLKSILFFTSNITFHNCSFNMYILSITILYDMYR